MLPSFFFQEFEYFFSLISVAIVANVQRLTWSPIRRLASKGMSLFVISILNFKKVFSAFIFSGECQRGVCVSFCEKLSINQKPCICRNGLFYSFNDKWYKYLLFLTLLHFPETQSCYRCCRLNATAECLPYSDSVNPLTQLADGTRCFTGYCAAVCCS